MLFSNILIKSPWLLFLTLIIWFCSLYQLHDEDFIEESWNYYVDHREFSQSLQNSHLTDLKLLHEGEGHYEPLSLEITTKDNLVHTLLIDDLNHTHIDEKLRLQKQEIKHAILKSSHPINFDKQEKVRLLQDITETDDFVLVSVKFFGYIFPLIRNLLLIGILFNEIDFFLPLIMMTESILMFAFLDNEKHYLIQLFKMVFRSNLDLLNFIRNNIFTVTENELINGNPLLSQYGFGQNILHNLSGELTLIVGFFALTILIKLGAALLKFEKLRSAGSKMRGILNGILFCFLPRILTFSTFSIRQISFDTLNDTLYPIIGISLIVGYIVFLVKLWHQIRTILEKIEYFEESRNEIGLVTRIQHKSKFEFDCIKCSNLYYPVINMMRLFMFFIPIGAAYDFTYGSFGGVIVSQMIYIMFTVSSSGFIKARDSVVYPLCDFLLLILQLSHIAIGLAENVKHTEVTIIAEKVFFIILLIIYLQLFGSLCADVSNRIKEHCTKNNKKDFKIDDKDLKSTKFKRTIKRKITEPNECTKESNEHEETKTTCKSYKTEKKESVFIDDSIQDNQSENETPFNFERTFTQVKPKIRKIRQGKII